MLTFRYSRAITLRSRTLRIAKILGVGSLVFCVLAAVSPFAVAKEKYTVDPVTGTIAFRVMEEPIPRS